MYLIKRKPIIISYWIKKHLLKNWNSFVRLFKHVSLGLGWHIVRLSIPMSSLNSQGNTVFGREYYLYLFYEGLVLNAHALTYSNAVLIKIELL